MLGVVLAMGLLTPVPIRQVFRHARRVRAGEKCPARTSLCMARQQLGVAPLRQLQAAVVRLVGTPQTRRAGYRQWRLVG